MAQYLGFLSGTQRDSQFYQFQTIPRRAVQQGKIDKILDKPP